MSIIYINGKPEEFIGNKDYKGRIIHRVDGPALIFDNGSKFWYLNGECHREDGPAVITADGTISWYLNGDYYSFEDFLKQLPEEDAVMVKLTWG
jgi:hypothetical protein